MSRICQQTRISACIGASASKVRSHAFSCGWGILGTGRFPFGRAYYKVAVCVSPSQCSFGRTTCNSALMSRAKDR